MVVKMLGAILPIIGTFVIILIIIAAIVLTNPNFMGFNYEYPKSEKDDWFNMWVENQLRLTMKTDYSSKSLAYQDGYEDCFDSVVSAYSKVYPRIKLSIKFNEE